MRAAAVLCLLACFAAVSAVEIPFHRDPAKKTVPSFTVHEDGRITHLPFSEEYFKQGCTFFVFFSLSLLHFIFPLRSAGLKCLGPCLALLVSLRVLRWCLGVGLMLVWGVYGCVLRGKSRCLSCVSVYLCRCLCVELGLGPIFCGVEFSARVQVFQSVMSVF